MAGLHTFAHLAHYDWQLHTLGLPLDCSEWLSGTSVCVHVHAPEIMVPC